LDYFPAFLNLDARNCLLVGAGSVASRKARLLLDAGARLTIVAPKVGKAMSKLIQGHDVSLLQREFRADDIAGHWLVVAATSDASVQRSVKVAADEAHVFCNSVDNVGHSSYITPAIVDRGAVVVAISSGGAAPVLARKIRAQIETLIPAATARVAEVAREWRDEVGRRITDTFSRRRFWERVFDRWVTTHEEMSQLVEGAEQSGHQAGRAWLVGAGPGDPELLTLRALQAMQSADVILHDRLVSENVLALARRDADRISVGKTPGSSRNSQEEINDILVSLVASGKRVCRLKGGDPFIFGRGGEEAEALAQAGLSCEVIPGITAAAGCAAYAGIPLTHRDASQSVVLITGHGKDSVDRLDWPSLARDRQTLAVYMAVKRFPDLMNKLITHGRAADTPVAIIENGTTPDQRVIRGSLGQLTLLSQAHQVSAPAMLIIGEVANLGQDHEQTIRGLKDDLRQYSADYR
jgi:uroporphyrin-III C-methyltransferase/precorrin-2 dehydrogenase/sirohydrochlorin ferrochelatase